MADHHLPTLQQHQILHPLTQTKPSMQFRHNTAAEQRTSRRKSPNLAHTESKRGEEGRGDAYGVYQVQDAAGRRHREAGCGARGRRGRSRRRGHGGRIHASTARTASSCRRGRGAAEDPSFLSSLRARRRFADGEASSARQTAPRRKTRNGGRKRRAEGTSATTDRRATYGPDRHVYEKGLYN
jgi:hypothetical protein